MDTKNVCGLCLVSKNEIIHFFCDEAIKLNITNILVQHFWFQIHRDDNLAIGICRICWKCVNDFHEFYINIKLIHKCHYDNVQIENDINILDIKTEITDFNNDASSSNQPNIKLVVVEPIVGLEIDTDKNAVRKSNRKQNCLKNVSNETCYQSLNKSQSSASKTNKYYNRIKKNISKKKSDSQRKITATKTIKKNMNKKLKDIKKLKPKTKELTQSLDDRIVNDIIINDDLVEIKEEFNLTNYAMMYDNSSHSGENQTEEKKENLDNNPERVADDIKIGEFYNLKCEICSSQHLTLFELKNHYRNSHNTKNGYVLCCNKKLFRRCQLLEHIFWHTNPDAFKCKVCNQIYANKVGLKIHMHFHSTPEERTYICDICDASFTLRYHLMRHFRKIHLTQVDRSFKCIQCDKSFKKKLLLQSHIRGVHELKNVNVCPVCAKVYKSKQRCDSHYLDEHVNANKPKIQCNLCGSMLKNENSLKLHIRCKHLEGPTACKLCGKTVASKNSLRNHMRYVHADPKHKCNLCGKAFARQIRLKEHMATHSGHSYLYTCPYCTTSFNSDANMYAHRKKKHPIEWLADRQGRLGITVTN